MKQKPITIDQLAGMVQKGFQDVDDQFHAFGTRFDRLERELKLIRRQLDNVIYRHEFEKLKDRVEELENTFGILRKKAA